MSKKTHQKKVDRRHEMARRDSAGSGRFWSMSPAFMNAVGQAAGAALAHAKKTMTLEEYETLLNAPDDVKAAYIREHTEMLASGVRSI